MNLEKSFHFTKNQLTIKNFYLKTAINSRQNLYLKKKRTKQEFNIETHVFQQLIQGEFFKSIFVF